MSFRKFRRRLRLWLAPSGSRADRWFRSAVELSNRLLRASPLKILAKLTPGFIRQPIRAKYRQYKLAKLRPLRAELRELVSVYSGCPLFVFPPSLDWNTQLFQRPQQLALALAEQGALVFYLQSKWTAEAAHFEEIQARMVLCHVPIELFWEFSQPFVYILTWNRDYLSAFQSPRVIYDYVDEIEAFAGNHARMYRDHEKLVRSADLVLTTAERLYQKVVTVRREALLCPNGVNYSHFAHPGPQPAPEDMLPILAQGKPIVGYYGALAQWFDYDLLTGLAILRPDLSFVLIGPDYDSSLPPQLLDLANVVWLGVKPYSLLPNYVRHFDVTTIPFQLNEITHATSPLKLFEYMAAGKPTVITPMHESMRYPGVLVARDPAEFSQRIDEALQRKDDPDFIQFIRSVAQENTWNARAKQILQALDLPEH